jgi:hypothetical protein
MALMQSVPKIIFLNRMQSQPHYWRKNYTACYSLYLHVYSFCPPHMKHYDLRDGTKDSHNPAKEKAQCVVWLVESNAMITVYWNYCKVYVKNQYSKPTIHRVYE